MLPSIACLTYSGKQARFLQLSHFPYVVSFGGPVRCVDANSVRVGERFDATSRVDRSKSILYRNSHGRSLGDSRLVCSRFRQIQKARELESVVSSLDW